MNLHLTCTFVDPDFQDADDNESDDENNDIELSDNEQDSDMNPDAKRKRETAKFLSKKKLKIGRDDVAALRKMNFPTSSLRGADKVEVSQTK
jgi:hypothetical protein